MGEGDKARLKRTGEEGRIAHIFSKHPLRGCGCSRRGAQRVVLSGRAGEAGEVGSVRILYAP